jgi:uncharacterized protein DUF6011
MENATAPDVHRCLRPGCGRKLTSAESIARGMGKACARKVREARQAADLSAWTPKQAEQARELIEDGGLVPAGQEGVFFAVSTDGSEIYRCSAEFCECPAGQASTPKLCYHRAGVVIVTASTASAAPVVEPLALAA